jgi:hypothetical protein
MTEGHEQQTIRERLAGYRPGSVEQERGKLVAAWRAAYPEAAAEERSRWLRPLIPMDCWKPVEATDPDEYWHNDVYTVSVRRHAKDPVFRSDGGMVQLGISSIDGTARHDWRDMQAIKNQLAGAECEAFELYPAANRLLDPSNYYTLWCFPGLRRINVGGEELKVKDADQALAPQRAQATPAGALSLIWYALAKSVKLQSHYARLLNLHDAGERMTFDNPSAWIRRLREMGNMERGLQEPEGLPSNEDYDAAHEHISRAVERLNPGHEWLAMMCLDLIAMGPKEVLKEWP